MNSQAHYKPRKKLSVPFVRMHHTFTKGVDLNSVEFFINEDNKLAAIHNSIAETLS